MEKWSVIQPRFLVPSPTLEASQTSITVLIAIISGSFPVTSIHPFFSSVQTLHPVSKHSVSPQLVFMEIILKFENFLLISSRFLT